MRFLVDECTGPAVATWLHDQGHDVFSIFEKARGMNDDDIIQKAVEENWILITNDKDFGNKVYRDGRLHKGIIFIPARLASPPNCAGLERGPERRATLLPCNKARTGRWRAGGKKAGQAK